MLQNEQPNRSTLNIILIQYPTLVLGSSMVLLLSRFVIQSETKKIICRFPTIFW